MTSIPSSSTTRPTAKRPGEIWWKPCGACEGRGPGPTSRFVRAGNSRPAVVFAEIFFGAGTPASSIPTAVPPDAMGASVWDLHPRITRSIAPLHPRDFRGRKWDCPLEIHSRLDFVPRWPEHAPVGAVESQNNPSSPSHLSTSHGGSHVGKNQ